MLLLKVRPYYRGDLDDIDQNEYGDKPLCKAVIEHEAAIKQTLIYNEEPVAILAGFKYAEGKMKVFMYADKSFNFKYAKDVKKIVNQLFIQYDLTRIETESIACESLDRWHKFLGFELEGVKRKFIEDKDYNVWGLVKWA